jgi:Mannitol repressor
MTLLGISELPRYHRSTADLLKIRNLTRELSVSGDWELTIMASNQELIDELRRVRARFLAASSKESDRGLALVTAEYFDAILERLLLARFAAGLKKRPKFIKPLFEGFGPLSTFSAKISVSYAIDLLQDWMVSDLDFVRRIRNEFAHSLDPKTFRDRTISKMVDGLVGIPEMVSKQISKFESTLGRPGTPEEITRYKFDFICGSIAGFLSAKVVVMDSDAPEEMKRSFMTNPEL